MADEQKQEEVSQEKPPLRKIVIETDGNNVYVTTNETVGQLELRAVLTAIITNLR